jgi:hypothetical protein
MIGWLILGSLVSTIGFWYWHRRRLVRYLGALVVNGYTRHIILACDALDDAAAEHRTRRKNLAKLVANVNATSPDALRLIVDEVEKRAPKRLKDVRRGILNSGGVLLMFKLYPEPETREPLPPLSAAIAFIAIGSKLGSMRVSDRSAMLEAIEELAQPEHLEMIHKVIALSESVAIEPDAFQILHALREDDNLN